MQNVVINVCEKFHYDRLRNDRALGNGKCDNNKNKNKYNVGSAYRPVSGSKTCYTSSLPDMRVPYFPVLHFNSPRVF